MSKYRQKPLDFAGLNTVSIHARGGKVRIEDFAKIPEGGTVSDLIDSLPRILAGNSIRSVMDAIAAARQAGKPVLWGLGGHVIKCGLAPVLTRLMEGGFATAFVLNGAASIHDYEIAIAGYTSEDVEAVLPDGRFGSAEETGRGMNRAIAEGARDGIGIGQALGRSLAAAPHRNWSLLSRAYEAGVPVTVHVAIGCDTPHTHPAADGSAIGQATHHDFRLLCTLISEMNEGGVYINAGSAVVLPEVFLKAVSVVRNLGNPLGRFTTVNLDFLQHYRPTANVVQRPHAQSGGQGYAITGHHELTIPLLAAALLERAR